MESKTNIKLRPARLGYIPRTPDPKAWVLGDARNEFPVLQPDGQWDDFLPAFESQVENGYDPLSCVSEAYTSVEEALERRKYGTAPEYSERFLAQISGTERKGGNSLHDVCETARLVGLVPEEQWPSLGIPREEFYVQPPAELYGLARKDHDTYERLHKDVPATKGAIKRALLSSPLMFSVFAWTRRDDGIYYEPDNVRDTHCAVIYGFTEEYVKVFDSAEPFLKKGAWEAINGEVKMLYVGIAPPTMSLLDKLAAALRSLLAALPDILKPATPPIRPVEPPKPADPTPEPPKQESPLLEAFCKAIQAHEGWFEGSRSWRNNNPGNIKYGVFARACGATGRDSGGFAIFPDYETGFSALKKLVTNAATGKSALYRPDMTLYEFFSTYAPSSDNNDPDAYAHAVAARVGIDPLLPIRELV